MTTPSAPGGDRDRASDARLHEHLVAAERIGLRRPWQIIFDRGAGYTQRGGEWVRVEGVAIKPESVRIVDADRRLIAWFRPDSTEYEALTLEAMHLIVEAVNAAE